MNSFVKVVLDADPGKFISGFTSAQGAVGKFGATLSGTREIARSASNMFDTVAAKASSLGHKIAAGGATIEATFVGAGISAAKFETNMVNVRTLLDQGFSDRSFVQMEQSIIAMSNVLPQGANDLATGLYNIASSGFYGADALMVLEASAKAATAGLSTTQNASTAITAVLNAYGLQAKDASYVSDVLFQTVNKGVVTFDQLTGVIGQVVGTAAAAKSPIQDVGAALATMTLSGISADEAGTSLNRVYQSLIDPSESLAAALHILGYESGAQAIQVDGLRGVMEKLRVASGGNISTLLQWFNEIRAARGVFALMSADGENYARVAADIEDKQKVAGATQRAYALQSETAANAFQLLRNAIHGLAIEVGTYLLPAATMIFNILKALVNAVSSLPGPIKAVAAYAGILAGAFLFLGGMLLAWRVKNLITQTAVNGLGRAMLAMSKDTALAGTAFERTGAKLAAQNGPLAVTRAMLNLGGGATSAFSGHLTNLGTRIQDVGSRMPFLGGAVSSVGVGLEKAAGSGNLFSMAMGRIKSGALSLVGHLGLILAGVMAVTSAYMQGQSAADDYVASLEKGFDKSDPESASKTYEKMMIQHDKLLKKMQDVGNSPGGFFGQLAKDLGDAATNIIGVDVIKDSSWDNLFKLNKLEGAEKKIARSINNVRLNATNIWGSVTPGGGAKGLLGLDSRELNEIVRISDKLGISLYDGFSKSAPARQKVLDEYRRLHGLIGATGLETTKVTEEDIAKYQDLAKAVEDAGKSASDSFRKAFNVFDAVDPKLGDVAGQIEKFYTDSTTNAQQFYDNVGQLQARGLSVENIAKLLEAGPAQAGPIVQALVEDNTNSLIKIMNDGEAALDSINVHAIHMAQLTQMALQDTSGRKADLLGQAMAVRTAMEQIGPGATAEDVARITGFTKENIDKVVQEFGLNLRSAIKPEEWLPDSAITGKGTLEQQAKEKEAIEGRRQAMADLYKEMISHTGVITSDAEAIAKSVDKALQIDGTTEEGYKKKHKAFNEIRDQIMAMDLLPWEKKFLLDLVGADEAKARLDRFVGAKYPGFGPDGSVWTVDQKTIDFLVSLTGDADAEAKLEAFVKQLNMTPQQWAVLLDLLGTEESKKKAEDVRQAIALLKSKNIPVTVDHVQAILDAQSVGSAVANIDGKEVTITVHTSDAQANVEALAGAVDRVIGKLGSWGVFEKTSANGNIFAAYAEGGHNATIGAGTVSRVWNEPETGGESYIPWAPAKRRRSLNILGVTANAFGYGLVRKYADGGVSMPTSTGVMVAAAGPSTSVFRTTIEVKGHIYGDEHLKKTMEVSLDERDKRLADKLRQNRR